MEKDIKKTLRFIKDNQKDIEKVLKDKGYGDDRIKGIMKETLKPAVTKGVASISDDLAKLKPQTDDLLAEAKKYKSAEKFVKAQGVTKDYVAEVKPTKLRADDRSVFKTAGEARGNAREITNKEIEIAGRDQKIFDANKDKTIPQLQKEIAESKKWADENSVSYPRSIQVKEEIIKTKSQLTDIWNKAQANIKPATETLNSSDPFFILHYWGYPVSIRHYKRHCWN